MRNVDMACPHSILVLLHGHFMINSPDKDFIQMIHSEEKFSCNNHDLSFKKCCVPNDEASAFA